MAKRKKQRVRQEQKAGPAPETSAAPERKPQASDPAKSEKAPKKSAGAPLAESRRSGIRVSTCVAGMLMTFALGLYLGTLMPGIMREMDAKGQAGPEVSVPAPPPESVVALAELIKSLKQKAEAHPEDAGAWIELGNAYFDYGKPPLAISAYEKALSLAPGNADVITDLGIMYRENGHPQKALECFKKAVIINPAHQNAMYNEGVVLGMDLGRRDEAIAIWKKLLELNPHARAPDGSSLADMIKKLR